jgi:IS605 OrfB family transposase
VKTNSLILSYELTLPQRIYPKLDRLFSVFKWKVRNLISNLWNEEGFKLLKEKGSACGILKNVIEKPLNLPSRIHRNILELSGQIIRSHLERKRIFDYIIEKPCRVFYDEKDIAKDLDTSPLFVLNVQNQIKNFLQKEKKKRDYFSVVKPNFSGNVIITSADDNLEKGQFKRLKIEGNKVTFEIKIPTSESWEWIKVKKFIPDRLKKVLSRAKDIKAPLIKRVFLKSGFTIYRLVIPVEIEVKVEEKIKRVFAIDLSPSEKRLGIGVVVSENGYSKPVFFSAYKKVRKLERIYKEISNLERKIDNIANQIHSTFKKKHRAQLYQRLKHLYQERRLRWRKFKELRKQILEIFVNFVIEHARGYDCNAIAIEELKLKNLPAWNNKRFRKLFSLWFYSRFSKRLEHKALRNGLRVIKVDSYGNSKICHKCGFEGKVNKLKFYCPKCQKSFDRDYNGAVNIGVKALRVCRTKPKPYMGKGIPGRVSFPQGPTHQILPFKFKALLFTISFLRLLSYLKVVETSYLKFGRLTGLVT